MIVLINGSWQFRKTYKYNYIIMEFTVKPREWGKSLGITLPKRIVDDLNIQQGEDIIVTIRKKADLKSLKGMFKLNKSAQQLKDEMREIWQ